MSAGIEFQIKPGFAVPIASTTHPRAEEINPALRELCAQRVEAGAVHANPEPEAWLGKGVFESVADVFTWREAPAVSLREFTTAAMYRLIAELNGYAREDIEQLHMRAAACFHVMESGGAVGVRNHPMWGWVGIYCIDSGYPENADAASGHIEWLNPNATAGMYVDASVAAVRPPWSLAAKRLALRPGELVVFPAWMQYSVMPYTGSGRRTTVTFCAGFQPGPSDSTSNR